MKKIFPDDFMWGVATSSYQIEGAAFEDGKGLSVWDTFSHEHGRIKNNENGDITCDHYHLWKNDIEILDDLGVQAYRLSVSWPRINPTGFDKTPNKKGLDFYDRLVDNLLEKDIIPFITLFHWDLPQELEDNGGWTVRDITNAFVQYVDMISRYLGDRVKHWITHNEPWCVSYLGYINGQFPPGIKDSWSKSFATVHHLLLSHGLAIPVIRSNSKDSHIGISLNLNHSIPASSSVHDKEACHEYDGRFNRFFLDPLYNKQYPEDIMDGFIEEGLLTPQDLEIVQDGDLNIISTNTDFLGINYYSRGIIRNSKISEKDNLPVEITQGEKTEYGWEIHPESLYDLLMRVKSDYKVGNIYITENGCSYSYSPDSSSKINDEKRIHFHKVHIKELQRAVKDGISCKGYFAWSLMDNFEWAQGFSQRFGLVWVDFNTLERIPKESYYWYKKFIEQNGNGNDTY
jgi:beta-glucosidase